MNSKLVDIAEEITENMLIESLLDGEMWEHDGGDDPDSMVLTEQAQEIFDSVYETLESHSND